MDKYPTSIYLCMCGGELLSQLGDVVTAMNLFKKAHALNPQSPLPFVNAARTYQQLGQISTAQAHLEKAISIDPSLAMSYIDLSQLQLQSGMTDKAVQTLSKALELARHMSEIKDVLMARQIATAQSALELQGICRPLTSQ